MTLTSGGQGARPTDATLSALRHIVDTGGSTRPALTAALGLTRAGVLQAVAPLLETSLVIEDGVDKPARGRPATVLRLNPDAGVILAADLGSSHCTLGVADLAGDLIAQQDHAIDITDGPDRVLPWLEKSLWALLTETGHTAEDAVMLGVGVPGPVGSAQTGPIDAPNMPGWNRVDVAGELTSALGTTTIVENDANCMALGEYQTHWRDSTGNLVLVKVGTGIGCGIIMGGTLQRGEHGGAGEIGHTYLGSSSARCSCGNVGCLDATASGRAILGQLHLADIDAAGPRDIVARASEGEAYVSSQLRNAGRNIGEVLAAILNFANPSVVLLAGALSEGDAGAHLLAGVKESVYRRSPPLANLRLELTTARLGRLAGLVGAVTVAQNAVLTRTWLDGHLETMGS